LPKLKTVIARALLGVANDAGATGMRRPSLARLFRRLDILQQLADVRRLKRVLTGAIEALVFAAARALYE
jgi:hypothetical protein